jgi:hypothetical protein
MKDRSKSSNDSLSKRVGLRDHHWNAEFKKLEKYIKRHGTWRVKKNIDIRLSEWLKRQKRNYEHLSKERRRKLEQAGVKGTYQISNEAWESKFEEVRLFKKAHGHFVVGKSNKTLFEWIQNQKWMKNKGKLTAKREKKLARIGFVWSGEIMQKRHEHWEMMFTKFTEFQRKHGIRYILILKDYKDMYAWVDRQKRNKRKLSREKINQLNAIQFPWRIRDLQVQARLKIT